MRIDNFEAFDIYKMFPDIDNDRYYNYRPKKKNKLIKGAKYSLKGMSCDGFEMPERVYQVVSVVHDVNDVVLNSVVMRQLEGLEDDFKYSLNKTECQTLHIQYEPGLQLFPIEMNWKKYNEKIDTGKTNFVKTDMSTYPVSRIDGNIRYIILKINGYLIEGREIVNLSNDKRYPVETFLTSLQVSARDYVAYSPDPKSNNNIFFMRSEKVPFRILSEGMITNANKDGLYIELFTKKPSKNIYTVDGISGINPLAFRNKKVDEIFEITLDEFRLSKKTKKRGASLKSEESKQSDPTRVLESYSPKFNIVSIKSEDDLYGIPSKRRRGDLYYYSGMDKLFMFNRNKMILIKPTF